MKEVVAGRFDYAEMSKRALATQWRPLSSAERTEFVEAFKSFLSDRYAKRSKATAGNRLSIYPNGLKEPMQRYGPNYSRIK